MFAFHHVALSVVNIEASLDFYSALGFAKVHEWRADDGSLHIVQLRLGEALLELFCYAVPQPAPESTRTLETDLPRIGVKHFGVQVASLHQARAALAAKGYHAATGIRHGRTGIDYFFLRDPSGILVEVVQDERGL